MTPRPAVPTTKTSDIYITNKVAKTSKNGGTYFMLESTIGTLVCFDEDLVSNLDVSDSKAYTLALAEPTGGFKYKNVKGLVSFESKPRPAAATPPPPAQQPALRQYSRPQAPVDDRMAHREEMKATFEEKDFRISKLSIFSSIVNLMSAKIKADPEFAKKSMADMISEAVVEASIVTADFVYGVTKAGGISSASAPDASPSQPATPPQVPAPASQAAPAQSVNPSTAPAPAYAPAAPVPPTYAAPAAAQAPAPQYPPQAPVVPPAPQYVPPPAAPAAPQNPQAEAQKLFGVSSDLEARMAERLKQLTQGAKR